ncbi:MAG: sigma-54 dependent transcriptional regulator [Rhodocyclaceae bacterium]
MTPAKHRICLIEDDEILGEALVDRFELEGFEHDWFRRGKDALLPLSHKRYSVVLSDINLPDITGQALFEGLVAEGRKLPPFVFITGYGAVDAAVSLLKLGAEDYLTKPFDVGKLMEKLHMLCARALPDESVASAAGADGPLLGISAAMRQVAESLPRLAVNSSTVLISGESGVGKEVVAHALHQARYQDGGRPFIAVNCGAITETLIESELFGYEKGAFTGAARERRGVFEQADGGTLFLDEIGEMPLSMQVRLLRAIQERAIVRVGGERLIPVNLKLVCATNQDLRAMVERGEFREDLYYRVNVIHIPIPPLRERKEDILWLAMRFLEAFSRQDGGSLRQLDPAARQALAAYPWPGNVRELKHCLERATVLYSAPLLTEPMLFDGGRAPDAVAGGPETLSDYLRACEKVYIASALDQHDKRIVDTAAALGISRKNLWEKMRKLGLSGAE